jgi:hypothetical protein
VSILDPGESAALTDQREPPREIKNTARALLDDDSFVAVVWRVLAGYHDLRQFECDTTAPREKLRDDAEEVLSAVHRLNNAIRKTGHSFDKIDKALKEAQRDYDAYLSRLDNDNTRLTRNNTLRWLVGSLVNVFEAYGVPTRNLVGFIATSLPVVSPASDDPPSKSTIRNAYNEKCK